MTRFPVIRFLISCNFYSNYHTFSISLMNEVFDPSSLILFISALCYFAINVNLRKSCSYYFHLSVIAPFVQFGL